MKYFLANHKMNFTYKDMNSYWKTFNEIYVKNKENPKLKMENKKVGFFVPFTNLKETKKLIKNSGVMLGAQNVHFADNGSYTGEISADMLKECQTDIVLIGHSERRKFAGETDEDINKKIKQMMKYNIKSLLCIGETKEERKKLLTKKVIASQLKKALADLYENEFMSQFGQLEQVKLQQIK